jgi:hypothetical protein
MASLVPTTKVMAGTSAGLIAIVIAEELQNRLGIMLTGNEQALLALVVSAIGGYITPHIPPPPKSADAPESTPKVTP